MKKKLIDNNKLKKEIFNQFLKYTDLASKSGLPLNDIHNIIYGKSQNIKKLDVIAKILNRPCIEFLNIQESQNNNIIFNKELYIQCLNLVEEIFIDKNINYNLETISQYTKEVYKFSWEESKKADRGFAIGIIESAIKYGIL